MTAVGVPPSMFDVGRSMFDVQVFYFTRCFIRDISCASVVKNRLYASPLRVPYELMDLQVELSIQVILKNPFYQDLGVHLFKHG
jgi:hypothetical protein